MKKQNGFISSSSSVSISYSSTHTAVGNPTVEWSNLRESLRNYTDVSLGSRTEYTGFTSKSGSSNISWVTFGSTSYHKIEYFIEAVEKLQNPFESEAKTFVPLTCYNSDLMKTNLYNGFVDVVITFPVEIRLAGIELLNPWINKLSSGPERNNWKYLPTKFSIFKVNNAITNKALEKITYENDIAKITKDATSENYSIRPVKYSSIETDENLIFLGKYDINWENRNSYKCFFKYNQLDPASLNTKLASNSTGTATWMCKQIVIRIFESKIYQEEREKYPLITNYINYQIAKYIHENETRLGTTYNDRPPTIEECINLIGKENIKPGKSIDNSNNLGIYWNFGGNSTRSYSKVKDVKFETGITYKLGGIQLLLSPDIFSVSEMKMYNYANRENNKVFIGEWNKDNKSVEYYGTGVIKTSPMIDISEDINTTYISWKHNFNIPPKYLEAKMYIKFNMDYGSFYNGDVISNLVNINKEPLTIKLTGTEVSVNIANGICFTNPDSGEFISFKDGMGIQMDNPGNFDAYNAASKIGAPILDYGSTKSAVIKGGYPFDIYFVVKRLF